jgi:CHASE2 domain-containing sensor protein
MDFLIVLNLGKGNLQSGCDSVTAQLWEADRPQPMQFTGSLPSATGLAGLDQRWRSLYIALSSHRNWRRSRSAFELDETDVTHISQISVADFEDTCAQLHRQLNAWLKVASFQPIEQQLRTRLNPHDAIRLIIVAEDSALLQLPWHLWQFLDDYPHAEIALSPLDYSRSVTSTVSKPSTQVNVLAILGDSQGIDVAHDRQLLEQLPHARIHFLIEPTTQALTEKLWEPGWDILFFAGHSSSQGQRQDQTQGKGVIQINPRESLTIDQLKYSLRQAIRQGLKLAIFNSCDGLGLARDLSDLHLPQIIVMREPVPDRVAQLFLKQFLTSFSSGQSLYQSVRQAREQLQAIEADFPCATWLPVICQNPAEVPPYWQDWHNQSQPKVAKKWLAATLLSSLLTVGIVGLVRSLGGLQTAELAMYDQFIRSRPIEPPDPRLLIVTVTDQDIQAQGAEPRRGSLSDRTLNKVLKILEASDPRAIGLDIYRDFAANQPALAAQFKTNDRLISICKRPDPRDNPTGILPPPEMPETQIGFSDFVQDRDATLRRHLLSMTANPTSHCTAAYAFSTQLALRYLAEDGVTAGFTPQGDLQLDRRRFPRLADRFSGYQSIDNRGLQLLLNYRQTASPKEIAPQVTITELLQGQVNPKAIKDRIVLIGVTSATSGDNWSTPYGQSFSSKIPGVMIQAHMTSQILSAVRDRRALIQAWAIWQDSLWIISWTIVGSILAVHLRQWVWRFTATLVILIILSSISWILFLQAIWIPIVPPVISLLLTSLIAPKLRVSLTPEGSTR